MKYRRKLFKEKDLFSQNVEELFMSAIRENAAFHYARNENYRRIFDAEGFSVPELTSCDSLTKLPCIPTVFFKTNNINTLKKSLGVFPVYSSGTSGNRSEINCELSALFCALRMGIRVGQYRDLFSIKPVRYLILGYKPDKVNKAVASRTALAATLFAPALSRDYVVKREEDGWDCEWSEVIECLEKFSGRKDPVRLIGFPSYGWFLMKKMEEKL